MGESQEGMFMRRALPLMALCLVLSSPLLAEMPYPANPQPCSDANTDPPCIDARDFWRYLFLPTTTPPTRPNDFGNDNWKLTSDTTGDPAIDDNPQELFGVKPIAAAAQEACARLMRQGVSQRGRTGTSDARTESLH
jgi:hypothetical protein